MSNVHELSYLKEKIEELKKDGVYRTLPVMETASEAEVILNGKKVINLSSNNYLGFANNDRIKKAAIAAIEKYGAGSGAVRTIIGNMDIHEDLEKLLAKFKKDEAAFLYQSAFNCNAGTIQAITEPGDIIISDELNHASIIDGCRLSKASKTVFKHSDMDSLEAVLKDARKNYKNILIITDGVFSMDGDIAKLPEIVELAEKYEAMTYVDDSHGSGVLGESGRGTIDHFGLHGRVDFSMGCLSKGIGVMGGYVSGSQTMYDWLSHRSRPVLFSTSLPPAVVGAVTEAVTMLMESTEYTDKLWENARYWKEKIGGLGFNTGHSETPITPVIIGDEAKTMEFSRKLLENGVFVSGIVFPTVPKGTGRVRCMVTAAHTKEQLDRAVEVFEKVGKEMNILK
ncbi:glycine C-acetyltransferase [Tissierella sp. MB52-C2]|uniref:glycine C-acetyltransferase n=1 Tax=Tissierella sp. MB52-C2 TaxID=3070999 RepID=UPI00280B3D4A|nr:glycine C-acetyltransferase [Tissierella sp. MB52-C2]WMM25760.1 glycine C-acetyltransferase [Tissierella sp. MB52-C2]